MVETLSILPLSFWVVVVLLIVGGANAWRHLTDGIGLPILAVLGTTTAWYVGDAFYNDYAHHHATMFEAGILDDAWWQVASFILVFLSITPSIHRWINHRYCSQQSGVVKLFRQGIAQPTIQNQLKLAFKGCAWTWIILFLIALALLGDQIVYFVFPFLGKSANPWSHGRVGNGLEFLSVPAIYLQLMVSSVFGIVLTLTTDRRIRLCALAFCLLAWPYFLFSRTRNMMLAMIIPSVLCWVFLRLRGTPWKKGIILLACFMAVNVWMKFIIANRTQMTITTALHQKGLNLAEQKKIHNEGLNMYEELCWISTFISDGRYHVNWGERYFAELANPIPRALWAGKPMIGIDYAIARGHAQADDTQGGVNTTISTGMIGQGVVNFGRILGPAFSALLMSFWATWLARLDLRIHEFGRLPLYSLGMILTFNLGRDITLITLYPFVFGGLLIWGVERFYRPRARGSPSSQKPRPTVIRKTNAQGAYPQFRPSKPKTTFVLVNRNKL